MDLELETGKDLKKWRDSNRFTQEELANQIDYSKTTIAHLEVSDKKLSKKVIKKVTELDSELHPVPKISKIEEQWNNIKYYSNFYGKEMKMIEDTLVSLLTVNVNKLGYDKAGAYLEFLSKSLKAINDIKEYQTCDVESMKKDLNQYLSKVYRESITYLTK